ncbi:MAG: hypothetical protein SF053_09875 [Bacteroidia bacterium]|nr:hypothetical protein [Bacteroidia bacterium]
MNRQFTFSKRWLGGAILALLLWPAGPAAAQSRSIGLRLGDPTGISFKKYAGDRALEINFGRMGAWYNDDWRGPWGWYDYDEPPFGRPDYYYLGRDGSAPLGLQVHYLLSKPIKRVIGEPTPGLSWYYGFGGQMSFQSRRYRYPVPGRGWYYTSGDRITAIGLGADGVLGLEYRIPGTQLVVNTDLVLYLELVDDPFFCWTQGGLGIRYMF